MAYVQYIDGTRELRSEAEAKKLWLIKVGRARPQTPAQKKYVSFIRKTIKKIRLNYRTAPEEYIKANIHDIVPMALANWMVNKKGQPIRPATKDDMEFAVKYGLWNQGKPTALVTGKGQLTLA